MDCKVIVKILGVDSDFLKSNRVWFVWTNDLPDMSFWRARNEAG